MMKHTFCVAITLALTAGALLLTGCGGEETSAVVPVALAVESAPTTLQEAFASASGELKEHADEAVRLLQNQDYSMALVVLQTLAARTDLTASQRGLTSQALLTANQKVAEAATNGNEEATKLQRYREFTK
jgi:hypothetical protein